MIVLKHNILVLLTMQAKNILDSNFCLQAY